VVLNEAILMLSWRDANALARKQAEAAMRLTAVAARARGARRWSSACTGPTSVSFRGS
jgi:hypothetical protein